MTRLWLTLILVSLSAPFPDAVVSVDLRGLRGTRRLRLGLASAIACLSFASCTAQTPTPAPLQVAIPPMASSDWSEWRLVTDFTSRVDIRGASILPPAEYGYRWTTARYHKAPSEAIAFRADAPSRVLLFLAASQMIPREEWRAYRGLRPEAFVQMVRQAWQRAASQYGDLEVIAKPDVDVACARFRANGPWRGYQGAPVRLFQTGRVCVHPDSPGLVIVVAGQAVPEFTAPAPTDEMANAFLDSLQFSPLGVAWRGPQ